jgi:hypothetical protein
MGAGACLTMNGVGEPCAGEPHARFDRGPLGKATTTVTEMGEKPAGLRPTSRHRVPEPAAYLTVMACDGT